MKKVIALGIFAVMGFCASAQEMGGSFSSENGKYIKIHENPIKDEKGNSYYTIYLNPFEISNFQRIASENYSKEKNGDYYIQPGVLFAAQLIEEKYGVKPEQINSWVELSFSGFFDETTARNLLLESYVSGITQVPHDDITTSQASYADTVSGSEIVPWYKAATNTNDALTSANSIYIVDMPLNVVTESAELNIAARSNDVRAGHPANSDYHGAHVHGLVGAKRNNMYIRGVNPGQPIRTFGFSRTSAGNIHEASFAGRLDATAYHAEWLGEFSTLNLSSNGSKYNGVDGDFNRRVRSLSNRFLVTQSAGNGNTNACAVSYNFFGAKKSNDGVIVVGGTTATGDRFTSGIDPIPASTVFGTPVAGSNYGPCVEAWAPGYQITSLDPTGGTRISTGTSFAAPIVAAIASRYGNSQTRPIEREQYINNNLSPSGYSAGGYLINLAKYVNPAASGIPKVIGVTNIWSPNGLTNISSVIDGKFYDLAAGYWNAGANTGSISLDLGSVKTVTGVRLSLRSSAGIGGSRVEFAVFKSNTDFYNPSTVVGYFGEDGHVDAAPIYLPLGTTSTRYLKIDGNNYGSWLAYIEIEVYGY